MTANEKKMIQKWIEEDVRRAEARIAGEYQRRSAQLEASIPREGLGAAEREILERLDAAQSARDAVLLELEAAGLNAESTQYPNYYKPTRLPQRVYLSRAVMNSSRKELDGKWQAAKELLDRKGHAAVLKVIAGDIPALAGLVAEIQAELEAVSLEGGSSDV